MASENRFENEKVTVEVERKPDCAVHMDIRVSSNLSEKTKDQAFKSIQKEVSLPGFRKGKAPKEIILKRYPKEIEREWREQVVNNAIREAMQLASLYPFDRSAKVEVDIKSDEKSGDMLVTANFETAPDTPSINQEPLNLKKLDEPVVEDKDIDQHIEYLRYEKADWEEVTGRSIEENDYIDVDISLLKEDGTAAPFLNNRRFHMKEDKIEKWLYDLVIGKEVGTPLEGSREQEDKKLPPQKLQVTVRAIQSATLPELTEEFAKEFQAEGIEDLQSKIRSGLEKQKHLERQKAHRNLMQDLLVETHPFDIPNSLVEKEAQARITSALKKLNEQEFSEKEHSEKKKEIEDLAKKGSRESLQLYYLLAKLIGEETLSVTEEEVNLRATESAYQSMNYQALKDKQAFEQLKDNARHELLVEKALDLLIERTA